jgi:glycosyltransferase involved in cell wall biosynthesis
MAKTCAVFIPILTSLKDWENTGILNRELCLYENHYQKFGTCFIIFTCGNQEDKKYEKMFEGITIIPLGIDNWISFLTKILFLPFSYHKLFQSVDIIKVDQMWSAWLGLWFSVFFNKKLWARMGYEHYQLQCSQDTHFLKRKFVFVLSLLTYRKASFITVTTENIKDFILETFGISPEKVHIKANYIDTNLFKRTNPPTILDRVLFIGRIDKVKNLFGIIEGCKQAGVGLDIIGKGPLKSELMAYADKLGADVQFKGIIPNEELPKTMEKYKLFILASFHEGNPKSLLEAMSMGCVCIATNVPGIRGLIKDEINGFLSDTTGESLRATIDKAIHKETSQICDNARKYILENNSLDKLIRFENDLL